MSICTSGNQNCIVSACSGQDLHLFSSAYDMTETDYLVAWCDGIVIDFTCIMYKHLFKDTSLACPHTQVLLSTYHLYY